MLHSRVTLKLIEKNSGLSEILIVKSWLGPIHCGL